ncbi:SCP2 sterol-binding domain-containing protein [Aquihabitans sp. McL0605]|uniref:SCP2 sterol-binding domain-containing protein n=1 Tax=Aquihabitans sp. McL0605 TaxID=3415671 RepID=UPI003CEA4E86
MAAYLSADWAAAPSDAAAEAYATTGATLSIGRIVSGAPDGEVRFTAKVADGAVSYEPGVDDAVDVTFTDTYPNALAIVQGELDPNAAFMRGQTKVTGSTGRLLDVLAATGTERYEQVRAALAATVEA